jgi:phage recombination protein Bet
MTDALIATDPATAVTAEQLALIKRTIAKDATDAELQMFLYDCQRRGTHPLDRLLHFSKRGGKYVPIVSIDFMRQRAAATNACAGIDDATFSGPPKTPDFAATITVWRLVQGQRCAFTATARWTEYKPDQDFMWQKMPHLMLGKTAEALALRRAFPTELAGTYIVEELEQAENGQPAPSSTLLDKDRAPVEDTAAKHAENGSTASDLPRRLNDPRPINPKRRPDLEPLTEPQRRKLFAEATRLGWPIDELKNALYAAFGIHSSKDLRRGDLDQALELVRRRPSREPGEDDVVPF